MTNIQTLAANTTSPKPKKLEAALMIESIYNGKELDSDDFARLYKFFMPTPPKTPKTTFEWLSKACVPDKEKIKPHLRFIYCNGELAAGTNGYRLHVAPCHFEPGYYDRNENPIENDQRFNEFHRILEIEKSITGIEIDLNNAAIQSINDRKNQKPVACYVVEIGNATAIHVSKENLDDALSCGGNPEYSIIKINGNSGLRIDFDDGRVAVIMPSG